MKSDKNAMVAGGLVAAGMAAQGPAGVGAFTQEITVPLWFVLAGWILPTGDILAAIRTYIPGVEVRKTKDRDTPDE